MSDNRRVTNNILWNFAGNALPLLAGLVAFPLLLKGLGVERFGPLSIPWGLGGYFSLFDLGLSRAITHVVAERIGLGDLRAASRAAATALLLMWLLGVAAAVMVWILTAWLAEGVLEMPAGIRQEAVASFRVLVISIPFVIHTAGLRGLLEAQHAFRVASTIRTVLGIGTFIGPLLVVSLGGSLVYVMEMLVVIRIAGWYAHKRAVAKHTNIDREHFTFDRQWLKPLFTFGGWMTVTNIVGPLMVYLDRFVIGATLSVAAISYYIVPYEVVTRAWIIPAAITGVLFPVFSAYWNTDQEKSAQYMHKGALYATIILFPAFGVLTYLAPEILTLWLGEKFAQEGTAVLRWLAAGALVASVAQIFFALIQGAGRADWTGKLHLAEAIPYWLLLLYLLDRYAIVGAAIAWFVRTAVDAFALMWLAARLGPPYRQGVQLPALLTVVTTALLLASTMLESLWLRSVLMVVGLPGFAWLAWSRLMAPGERAQVKEMLGAWKRRGNAAP